jgi:hypothetical protein
LRDVLQPAFAEPAAGREPRRRRCARARSALARRAETVKTSGRRRPAAFFRRLLGVFSSLRSPYREEFSSFDEATDVARSLATEPRPTLEVKRTSSGSWLVSAKSLDYEDVHPEESEESSDGDDVDPYDEEDRRMLDAASLEGAFGDSDDLARSHDDGWFYGE